MCDRPFRDVDEMNTVILDRAARMMTAKDDFVIVGDVARAKEPYRAAIAAGLNKIKARLHLGEGNHDPEWIKNMVDWHSVGKMMEIHDSGRKVVVSHYPLVTWNGIRSGAVNVFGHVHQHWAGRRMSVNVGVDQWDYTPVTLEQILERGRRLPISADQLLCEPGIADVNMDFRD